MIIPKLLTIAVLTGLLVWSCSSDESPVNGGDGTGRPGALFEVKVVDSAGTPVPGARVGAINYSPHLPLPTRPSEDTITPLFNVEIPESGLVTISVEDVYRRVVDTFFVDNMPADTVLVGWAADEDSDTNAPGGYYYLVIDKPDGSGGRTTEEIVTIWDWGYEPAFTTFGETDSTGLYSTNDTLLLPCLLRDPPPYVDGPDRDGDTIFDFYHDTIAMHLLFPPNFLVYQVFYVPLRPDTNYFELEYNGATAKLTARR